MSNINCPNCRARRAFTEEINKFKCASCNKSFKKCKINKCSNLVDYGGVCKECVGKGIRNGGSAALSLFLVAGGVAWKVLRKGK